MAASKHTHRHLVALPLAALLLGVIGLSNAVVPASASLLAEARRDLAVSAAETTKDIDLPSGLHLSLEPGAEAEVRADGKGVTVSKGNVLADTSGLAALSLPCLTVSLLDSAAYVTVADDSVSVAAVQGPVLLRLCDERAFFLTEGEQAYIVSGVVQRSVVPAVWLSDVRSRLASRPPQESSAADAYSAAFAAGAESSDAAAAFAVALTTDTETTAFLAFRLLPLLSHFDATTTSDVNAALFASDAFHMQVLQSVPHAVQNGSMALPEATVKAWAHAAAVAASDTPLAIKTMLEGVTALPSFLENAGYPKQSKLWMQAIEDTVTVLRPLVPSAERDSLDAILTSAFDRAPDIEAPLPAPRQEKAEEKKPTFTDEQLHRLTEFMLDNSEALQTLRTTVTPHAESQTARVQGIFLSEENRDVPYDFTYSPAMGTVSGIVREGVKLPNTMKLGTFFPSLQKEAP